MPFLLAAEDGHKPDSPIYSEHMKQFLYETHLHTKEASACSVSWACEYIQPYVNAGYSGIIVTDHFFNGNSCISRSLPWEQKIQQFCKGYENAKQAGEQAGLAVFFGWEHSFGNDEYLIYGLDKTWLLAHPQIMEWDHLQLFEAVDNSGGCMIQAHPFRERFYLSAIHLRPFAVHGIEAVNAENDAEFDRKACAYAQKYELAMTSGSDIHDAAKVGLVPGGMAFDHPLHTIADFVKAIKERKGYEILSDETHVQPPKSSDSDIPVYLYDASGSKKRVHAYNTWSQL